MVKTALCVLKGLKNVLPKLDGTHEHISVIFAKVKQAFLPEGSEGRATGSPNDDKPLRSL